MPLKVLLPAVSALIAGAVTALLLLGGDGRPTRGSTLRILFSGETMGELEPCECAGKMAGGLPVRGGYIEQQSGEFLLLDTGCIGGGARDFEILRAEAALRAMREMGYDAVNIGEHELWLGRKDLEELLKIGVPFVSANVVDEEGEHAVSPYLLVQVADLVVGVTGLVARDSYDPGPGLRVDFPEEALGRLLPELAAEAGALIVLADLDLRAVRNLALAFPEITVILFRGRGDSHAPERVNRTVIASIYGEARYLGDLVLTWETDRQCVATRGAAILMDDRFPRSEAVTRAAIGWYKAAVDGRIFDLSQARPGWSRIGARQPEPGNGYVGSEPCRDCHPYQYRRWRANPHARAMESLEKVGYEWSPECIVCHVVGYGADDGYVSMPKTPDLARVGCEACHGPGLALLGGACRGIARRAGEDRCRRCHTGKRHPGFVFQRHWEQIDHSETGRR